ncbi:MAG: trypsin-like peptidase domain-containing protein [Candidatus Dormibacteraeota bacterium]|nr:trypsin-like peptidase domain-containing protein [Candidatus Dormibacteraeota bacterium]
MGAAVALVAGLVGGFAGSALRSATSPGSPSTPAASSNGSAVCNAAQTSATVLPSLVHIAARRGASGGTGSGSVLDTSGHIITNDHVIEVGDGGSVTVDFSRGRSAVPATIVGRDPLTDVAVIKVGGDAGSLRPIAIGSGASLVVGQPVVALGAPLGLTDTVTTGVVSALDRIVNLGTASSPSVLVGAIQTDASVNPGNSGGPLVDCGGRQVGVNSAGASPGVSSRGGSVGLNFAIPMGFAMAEAKQLIATGSVTHSSVGLLGVTVTDEIAAATGLPHGVFVEQVVAEGPAASAGIRPGDVVTRVDNQAVRTFEDYLVAILGRKLGDTVQLTYIRGGASQTAGMRVVDASTLNFGV